MWFTFTKWVSAIIYSFEDFFFTAVENIHDTCGYKKQKIYVYFPLIHEKLKNSPPKLFWIESINGRSEGGGRGGGVRFFGQD